MNALDAMYRTVHAYPGGADSLAPRLGKHPGTLRLEVRPPAGGSAKLGLGTAIQIMDMTNDLTALDAMEQHFGRVAFPLPELVAPGDDALMDHVARVAKEFADVMTEVAAAAADGRITDNELQAVHRQWGELVAAGKPMLAHLASVNAAGKPASEQGAATVKHVGPRAA